MGSTVGNVLGAVLTTTRFPTTLPTRGEIMNAHTLTNENYFLDTSYMSVSAWKRFAKCEVLGIVPFDDSETSTAMLVGSYIDAWTEGTLDKFIEANPQIISSKGATKGELKSDFKQADEIIKYMESKPRIMKFLAGEKQRIMVGEIEGVPFKIKMDSYFPDKLICDLKTMRSVTDSQGNFTDFITPWQYDIQLACYQEIEFQNTGQRKPCYIVAVTKETPINSVVVQIPQEVLDRALYQVKSTIVDYYAVKMGNKEPVGCGKCKACIERREDTPLISMNLFLQN